MKSFDTLKENHEIIYFTVVKNMPVQACIINYRSGFNGAMKEGVFTFIFVVTVYILNDLISVYSNIFSNKYITITLTAGLRDRSMNKIIRI